MREALKVPYNAKTLRQYVNVPEGLADLMEGLVKEVLQKQPANIIGFAADYFENLVRMRDETAPTNETTAIFPNGVDPYIGMGEPSKINKLLRRRKQVQSQDIRNSFNSDDRNNTEICVDSLNLHNDSGQILNTEITEKDESNESNDETTSIKVITDVDKIIPLSGSFENFNDKENINVKNDSEEKGVVINSQNIDMHVDIHQIKTVDDHTGVTGNDYAEGVNEIGEIQVDNEIIKFSTDIDNESDSKNRKRIEAEKTIIFYKDNQNDNELKLDINKENISFNHDNGKRFGKGLSNKNISEVENIQTLALISQVSNTQENETQVDDNTDNNTESDIHDNSVSEKSPKNLLSPSSQETPDLKFNDSNNIMTINNADQNKHQEDSKNHAAIGAELNDTLFVFVSKNNIRPSKQTFLQDEVNDLLTKDNPSEDKESLNVAVDGDTYNENEKQQRSVMDKMVNDSQKDNIRNIALNHYDCYNDLDGNETILEIENKSTNDTDIIGLPKISKENSSHRTKNKNDDEPIVIINTKTASETPGLERSDGKIRNTNDEYQFLNRNTAAIIIQRAMKRFISRKREEILKANKVYPANDINMLQLNIHGEADNITQDGIVENQTVSSKVSEHLLTSRSTEDDSSALSSAATIIQAGIRGFLTRKSLQRSKMVDSSDTTVASIGDDSKSLDESLELDKTKYNADKTVILENFRNPDNESNLSIAGSLRAIEARKRLKREDAIQSQSPHSSGETTTLQDDIDDDEGSIGDLAKGIITEIIMNPKKVAVEDEVRENFVKRKSMTFDDGMFSNSPVEFHDKMNIEKTKLFLMREREFSDLIENDEPTNTGSYESYQTASNFNHNYDQSNDIAVKSVGSIALESFNVIQESLNNTTIIPIEDLDIEHSNKDMSILPLTIDEQDVITAVSKIDLTAAEMILSDDENSQNAESNTSKHIDVVDINFNEETKTTSKVQQLLHSGEFHDVMLPTRIERSDTAPLRGE